VLSCHAPRAEYGGEPHPVRDRGRLFRAAPFPLAAPGVFSAAALVFIAIATELTATLLLSPIGTNTLATRFWSLAGSVDYVQAAPYAAMMIIISAPVTYLLLQQSRRVRGR